MVMERLDAAGRHPKNQDPNRQSAINQARNLLITFGVIDPGSLSEINRLPSAQRLSSGEEIDRIDLDLEWRRQSGRYVELGFHVELGLSVEDYLASLPRFEPQPESFRGCFDIPVLVEIRIAPSRQAKMAGLLYFLEGITVRDWDNDPKGYKTPDVPYTTWMQDGGKNLGKSMEDVRQELKPDERGATEYDGIALYITNTRVLNEHDIDLPGTSVGSDGAPYLYQWYGIFKVDCHLVDRADSGFGSASCGRVAA